jgi:hypothetical protein
MRYRAPVLAIFAFAIGALSDIFLIRNGLSYSGPTLLDRYPILWPVWLIFIFACTYLIESRRRAAGGESQASYVFGPATAIWLGAMVTHAVLFIRDVTTDTTSHNLWPFEFLFWGIVVAAPAYGGSLLARRIPGRS